MSEQIKIHNALNEPISQKAYERAELLNLTPQQRTIYELSFFHSQDMRLAIETAVEEAVEQKKIQIAKNVILSGLDDDLIVRVIGLPLEIVVKLRNELKKK